VWAVHGMLQVDVGVDSGRLIVAVAHVRLYDGLPGRGLVGGLCSRRRRRSRGLSGRGRIRHCGGGMASWIGEGGAKRVGSGSDHGGSGGRASIGGASSGEGGGFRGVGHGFVQKSLTLKASMTRAETPGTFYRVSAGGD
jgi:hypothetical protein